MKNKIIAGIRTAFSPLNYCLLTLGASFPMICFLAEGFVLKASCLVLLAASILVGGRVYNANGATKWTIVSYVASTLLLVSSLASSALVPPFGNGYYSGRTWEIGSDFRSWSAYRVREKRNGPVTTVIFNRWFVKPCFVGCIDEQKVTDHDFMVNADVVSADGDKFEADITVNMRISVEQGDQAFIEYFQNGPANRDLHKYLLEQAGVLAAKCLQKAAARRTTRAFVTGVPPGDCVNEMDHFLPITVKIEQFNLHRPGVDLDIT